MNQVIPGLGPTLQDVPETSSEWLRWRERVLAYRTLIHRLCADDEIMQDTVRQLCVNDPAYFMTVFGVLHEPRTRPDLRIAEDGSTEVFLRPKGWYPWIPFGFQVETLRLIDETIADELDETGGGDAVVEKARDMGGTWSFCLHAAHGWLFADDFVVGMVSMKQENVDSDKPKSMFFKVESLLGINPKVPRKAFAPGTIYDDIPCRIPDWLMVSGFDSKEHDHKLNLIHPTKTNQIVGESTTSTTGTGDRWVYGVIDEAAKIKDLETMWDGLAGVTSHRFALSSADRSITDYMFKLVQQAREKQSNPGSFGPRLLSLPWGRNPLRDDAWLQRERSRFATNPHMFAQEHELDWDAAIGGIVYPYAKSITVGDFPHKPGMGQVYMTIDPGLTDPTAVACLQHDPVQSRFSVVESFALLIQNASDLAPILMGWPPGHPVRELIPDSLQDFVDFAWSIRKTGQRIVFVGDTYGEAVGGAGRDTYYGSLLRRSRELNAEYPDLPPVEIIVQVKYDEGARFHMARKDALTSLLQRLDFHDTPRVTYFLKALQSYRYREASSSMTTSEIQKPVHDWSSHPTTAIEFFAVFLKRGELSRRSPLPAPTRYALPA